MYFRGGTHRNRYVRYYLLKWYKLLKNFENLNEFYRLEAKILFTMLSVLDEDELALLEEKYNQPRPISDEKLAEKYNMKAYQFQKMRFKIEAKMINKGNELKKQYGKKRSELIDKRMYLNDGLTIEEW